MNVKKHVLNQPNHNIGEILNTAGGGHGNIRNAQIQCNNSSYSVIAKPYLQREANFYLQMKSTPLSKVIPKYYGVVNENSQSEWLLIQDLTAGMSSPCIADIKLGTRSYEINAPIQKQKKQISNMIGTTTKTHAIRIIDVRIRNDGKITACWDRNDGRKMDINTFQTVMKEFIPLDKHSQLISGLKNIHSSLLDTYSIFPNLRLYSASILVIYDSKNQQIPLKTVLIDFAHAYVDILSEGGDPSDHSFDDNSIKGITNLINLMETSSNNSISSKTASTQKF